MKKTTLDSLTSLQRRIVETIWKAGDATALDVQRKLGGRKPLAYTTVLTLLRRLEEAGWLAHRQEGRTFVYRPVQTRKEATRQSCLTLIQRLFEGRTGLLVQSLLDEEEFSSEELDEIQQLIKRKKQQLSR